VSSSRSIAVHDVLAAVQGAATITEVQCAYVEAVGRAIPAAAHGVYHFPRGDRAALRLQVRGASVDFLDEYERVGPGGDPVLAVLPRARRPVASHELMADRRWRRLPFYRTLARAGLDHTLQAPLLDAGVLVGTLNVARPAGDPPFSAHDRAVLGLLSVHLAAAHRRAARFEALAPPARRMLDELTPRERQVAELVLAGLSNRAAAAALGVAESTVKELLARVFRKLGVHSRMQLARVAAEE